MPSIIIREIDNTTGGGSSESTNIVYIPGFTSTADNAFPDGKADAAPALTPVLCKTVSEFERAFGVTAHIFDAPVYYEKNKSAGVAGQSVDVFDELLKDLYDDTTTTFIKSGTPDLSYVYAKELLYQGIPVLYESVNGVTAPVSVQSLYSNLNEMIANLKDKGEYEVKYITSGGYPTFEAGLPTVNAVSSEFSWGMPSVDTSTYAAPFNAGLYTIKYFGGEWTVSSDQVTNATLHTSVAEDTYTLKYSDKVVATITYFEGDKPCTNDTFKLKVEGPSTATVQSIEVGEDTVTYLRTMPKVLIDVDTFVQKTREEVKELNGYEDLRLLDKTTLNKFSRSFTCRTTKEGVQLFETTITQTIDGTSSTKVLTAEDMGIKLVGFEAFPDETTFEVSLTNTAIKNGLASTMVNVAAGRGDCVAIIDHAKLPNRPLVGSKSVYDAFKEFGKTGANMEFGVAFTPWVNIDCATIKDGQTTHAMPPSYAYLAALANSVKTNANWISVAGATRGQIPGLISDKPLEINKRLTNAIAEEEYQNRDSVSINAITNIKPFGYRIWGNRTLKNNAIEGNLTATSFLNIRNLVSDVKKVAYDTARRLTFEQNNDILWVNFTSEVARTLEQMKSGAGISGYKILKGTTTEKAKLVAIIKLYPVYSVEDFDITITMEDDEVSVS